MTEQPRNDAPQPPNEDDAPWIVRKWWMPVGLIVGFLYAALSTGVLGPEGSYRPGDYPVGALVIGVGICWVIDRFIVMPFRLRK